MNKAKMTFRFDGGDREFMPVQQKDPGEGVSGRASHQEGKGKREREHKREERVDKVVPFSGTPREQPMSQQGEDGISPESLPDPQYRAVETVEEWGDPFTDYTGINFTVFPEEQARGHMDLSFQEDKGWREPHYSRPNRSSWWKIAGSVTGAIVTGVLFGTVVLSMFNQELALPLPGPNIPVQSPTIQDTDLPVMGSVKEEFLSPEEAGMLVNMALPQQTYHFLQYGVFSSAAGVELAQQELKESGIAAAKDTVDEKRVYAGVSSDREQAKLLSSQLKASGVHLILHEITLPSSAEVRFSGDVTVFEHYLAQSAELVELLSSLSASRLSEVSPSALTDEEVAELTEKHQLWTESAAAVRSKLPDSLAQGNIVLENAMNSAVAAVHEYHKKSAKTLLWEVQNEIMRFVLEEYRMLGQQTP